MEVVVVVEPHYSAVVAVTVIVVVWVHMVAVGDRMAMVAVAAVVVAA